MSYVLHIWEHPDPASVAEADQIHTRLSAQRGMQNPAFLELAQRLTQRYPCITTLDDGDPEAAWTDGPLDGKTESLVYGIGVKSGMLSDVIPFVRTIASSLDLTVYDMQAAEVHLPNGRVLTLPGRAPVNFTVAHDPDTLETKAQVAQIVREDLRSLMEENGFKTLKGEIFFRKRYAQCTHEVVFDICDYYPEYRVSVFYWVVPKLDARLASLLSRYTSNACTVDFGKLTQISGVALSGQPIYGVGREWTVDGLASLHRILADLRDFLSVALLPLLMQCDSAARLDHFANRLPSGHSPFCEKYDNLDILIAHAAGDPDLDQRIAARLQASSPEQPPERLVKLLADLDAVRRDRKAAG